MTDFVLHLGLPKTATTTLQRGLFTHHDDIFFIGKSPQFPHPRGCRSEAMYLALAPWLWGGRGVFDPSALRAAVDDSMQGEPTSPRCVLASWEGLAMLPPSTLRWATELVRLRKEFLNVRIMVTLREPVSWAQSLYLQDLRGHFLGVRRDHLASRAHVTFEEWLQRREHHHGGDGIFSFHEQIRDAVKTLGKGCIGIFCHEEMQRDPLAFLQGICAFLDINAAQAAPDVSRLHLNTRLDTAQYAAIQATQASRLQHFRWRLNPASYGRKVLRSSRHAAADPAQPRGQEVPVAPTTAQYLQEQAAPHHRWLQQTFGLDLAQFGYRV